MPLTSSALDEVNFTSNAPQEAGDEMARSIVRIWADVRCPWCWIGHRQLGRAVQSLGSDLKIEYKSFLLEPEGPPRSGIAVRDAALSSWGLDEKSWNARREMIVEAGTAEMLTINIDTALVVDSRNAHRLLKLAAERNLDLHNAWDVMYARQFDCNDDIGDWEVLRSIGHEFGLNDEDIALLVETDQYKKSVSDDHREAVAHGVRSVPTVMVGSDRVRGDLADSVVRLVNLDRAVVSR